MSMSCTFFTCERVFKCMLSKDVVCSWYQPKSPLVELRRSEFIKWALEMYDFYDFASDVLPLTRTILDKFLSSVEEDASTVLMHGIACLSIALKVRENRGVFDTLTNEEFLGARAGTSLLNVELNVLNHLNWKIPAITATDFISFLLYKLHLHPGKNEELKTGSHSETVACFYTSSQNFTAHRSSAIAAGSIYNVLCQKNGKKWMNLRNESDEVLCSKLSCLISPDNPSDYSVLEIQLISREIDEIVASYM